MWLCICPHSDQSLAKPVLLTRSVPVLDVHDTNASGQGCGIRRTQNFIHRPRLLPSTHTTLKLTRSDLLRAHVCTPHFAPDKRVSRTDWRCGVSQSAYCDRRVRTGALHPRELHQLFDVSIITPVSPPSCPNPLWFKRVSFPRLWDN